MARQTQSRHSSSFESCRHRMFAVSAWRRLRTTASQQDAALPVIPSRAGIQSQVLIPFVFEARCGHNGIEHPLRLKFPADTAARNDGILSFHVNADANYELQIRIINIGAADLERHVEIGRARPESFAINAGGSF